MFNYQVFLIHICLVAFPLLCNKQQYVLTRKNPWTRWQPLCICHSFECNGTANPTGKKNPDPNPGSDWRVLVCICIVHISPHDIGSRDNHHRIPSSGRIDVCLHQDIFWLMAWHVLQKPCPPPAPVRTCNAIGSSEVYGIRIGFVLWVCLLR